MPRKRLAVWLMDHTFAALRHKRTWLVLGILIGKLV